MDQQMENPTLIKQWKKAGIKVIHDVCHQSEARLLSHVEMREKFGITCTFLDALALRLSIPLHWRELISENWTAPPIFPGGPLLLFPDQATVDINNLTAKQAYNALRSARKTENISLHRLLRAEGPLSVADEEEWFRVCKRVYATTRETKLQSFQFKVIHAITPCRKFLRQIRIADDDLCPKCAITDHIPHFFFQCSLVQPFWTAVSHWLSSQANIHMEHITPKEAVLGLNDSSPNGRITNFILLHFRYYIHRQRLFHDNHFELLHCLRELRGRLRCMERILRIEGKSHLFRKWHPLLQTLG